ncbi:MAG: hypothetical protein IPM85_11540 [Chitinophagaceae bacterium]|nr:hypothetical protein [Chitinophagaceae bacterium]
MKVETGRPMQEKFYEDSLQDADDIALTTDSILYEKWLVLAITVFYRII